MSTIKPIDTNTYYQLPEDVRVRLEQNGMSIEIFTLLKPDEQEAILNESGFNIKGLYIEHDQNAENIGIEPIDENQVNTLESQEEILTQISENGEAIKDEQAQVENQTKFGLTLEQWDKMSNAGKIQYLIAKGTKEQYTEDEWAKMNERQKERAQNKFIRQHLANTVHGWDKMSSVDKLNKISEFINKTQMADALKMNLKDLLNLEKDSPEEFKILETEYYTTHEKVDILNDAKKEIYNKIDEENERANEDFEKYCLANNIDLKGMDDKQKKLERLNYIEQKTQAGEELSLDEKKLNDVHSSKKELEQYAKEKGINLTKDNHLKTKYEYLKSKEPSELSMYEKEELEVIREIEESNGNSLDNIISGENKIFDILDSTLASDDHKNIETIQNEIDKHKFTTKEEFDLWIQQYDIKSQILIRKAVFREGYENKIAEAILLEPNGYVLNAKAVDKKSEKWVQAHVVDKGYKQYIKRLQEKGVSTECAVKLTKDIANNVDTPFASQLQVTTAELEDKVLLASANEGVGQREDALEVFAMTNKVFAESQTISDDMKQFYAQNSVEVLNTPEMREAQTKSLKSYNIESFNKGCQIAYENNTKPTQTKNYVPNTTLNQTPTKVADNKPQQQEKYTISEALRYVDTDTRAQSELIQLSKTTDFTTFLTTLSNNDRKLVIEKLCKYGSANDIYDLLCNNLNYCDSILRIAGNKLSGKMEQIIMMLLNKHDNSSIAQAKNLAKQEPKFMPLIAIRTNDHELIKEIVKNPLSYRIQPGSDTHRELLRKSNSINSGLSFADNGLNIKNA